MVTDPTTRPAGPKRAAIRRAMSIPVRLTWKDQRGATRFASAVTCNVSDSGVFVECVSPAPIPLYRLVQFQLERDLRNTDGLPASLRQGRLIAAVYRVVPPDSSGKHQGLALRLMVEPTRLSSDAVGPQTAVADTRATA